jgi:hypothetical protein
MTQTKTPGYNTRLAIYFQTDRNGKRRAYRWSGMQLRSFPVSAANAELWIAQDLADEIDGNPLKNPWER